MGRKDKETSPLQEGVSPPKSFFQSIRRKRDRKDTAHKYTNGENTTNTIKSRINHNG